MMPLAKETATIADVTSIIAPVVLIILPADLANGENFFTQLGFTMAIMLGAAQIVFIFFVIRLWFKTGQQRSSDALCHQKYTVTLAFRLVARRFFLQFFLTWLGIGVFFHLVSFQGVLSGWYLWVFFFISLFIVFASFAAYKLGTRLHSISKP